MATNDKSPRYDWHKDHPAVKLIAHFIECVCSMIEGVGTAFGKAAWAIAFLAMLWFFKQFTI